MPKKARKMPDGNDDIDHKIRMNELKEELREITGHEPTGWESPECPPEMKEEFYRSTLAYEKSPLTTPFEQLTRAGVDLPEAGHVPDAEIAAKLAALIEQLGKRRIFLYHTNHLSDRELYAWLREHGLRDEVPDLPVDPDACWHLDVLGSYGTEEVDLYNKFYATEAQRQEHLRDYPDWLLPPHSDPLYHRDHTLPKSPY